MTLTAPPAPAPAAPAGPGPRRPVVTALLVLRDGAAWLPGTLDALAAQERAPERLIVVDLASGDAGPDLVAAHPALHTAIADIAVRRLSDPQLSFEAAVDLAVAQAGPLPETESEAGEWLWLLPDDCAPAPDALARLVGAVRRSPSVGIVGPKVLGHGQPRRLLEIGHLLSRSGRRVAEPTRDETDQGQFDTRTDVLAVGRAGMLVRRGLFERIGGFAASPVPAGAALDLGWRAQLAGERVVVVPSAVVRSAAAPYAAPRPAAASDRVTARIADRVAARRVALTRCSPWAAPVLALWIALSSLACALGLLLLKRPTHAWVELGDLAALAHPWSVLRARWGFRGRRVLRRRDLATLFVTPGEALRHTGDRVQEALTPGFVAAETGRPGAPATETGPVSEEAEDLTVLPASLPHRIVTNPGVLTVVVTGIVAAVGWRSSLRGGLLDAQASGLVGGELARVATDSTGLWHAFRDSWHGAGFGGTGESGPLLGLLAVLTWITERLPYVAEGRSPASVTLAWLLVLGMPLAAAAAYLAGRVVTRARWVRALAALAWAGSGVLTAALSQGRVPAVLAHILLPLVVAGIARSAQREGSFTAAAATALAVGLLGACAPVALVPVLLAAGVLVLVGPGVARRVRGLMLLLLPLGMQGPALLGLREPATLLGAAGLLVEPAAAAAVPWWAHLLGHPDGGLAPQALLTLPVVVLAVAALWRRPPGRAAATGVGALALLAALGLALALSSPRLVVGSATSADGPLVAVAPWPGIGGQWLLVGLLGLALVGSVGLGVRLREHAPIALRIAAVAGVVLVGLALLAAAGLRAWDRLDGVVAVGRDPLPAVAVEQATGTDAVRLLVLAPRTDLVDYQLVGAEPGRILRGVAGARPGTDPGLGPVVASLAAGRTEPGATVGERLADLGIGFVSVRGDSDSGADSGAALSRTLDSAAGLTRLGTTDGQTLWRVLARPSATAPDVVAPGRVRIVTSAGALVRSVPVTGPHAQLAADIGSGPAGRLLVVAESPEWAEHAQVRVEGTPLTVRPGGGMPAYVLPAGGGRVTVDIPPAHPRWFLAQVGITLLTVFLAVPFGNRRSRRLR